MNKHYEEDLMKNRQQLALRANEIFTETIPEIRHRIQGLKAKMTLLSEQVCREEEIMTEMQARLEDLHQRIRYLDKLINKTGAGI